MIRKTDPEAIAAYLEDASGMGGGHADEVLVPTSAGEAAEALASSAADGVPVTLSGGGTGLTGGRIPLGGRILATDRLGEVKEVERRGEEGIAVVGPAATLAAIDAAAAELGLFLPPDPTETLAWAGGVISTNASGSHTFHYGPMRRYVRRLSLVLADGTTLDAPRGRYVADSAGRIALPTERGEIVVPVPSGEPPRVKSATGYARGPGVDLVDLVIGSEGTLALVTEVELLLLPRPEHVFGGIVFFDSEDACLAAVRELRARSHAARGFGGPAPPIPSIGAPPRPAASRVLLARALEYFGADALEFIRLVGKAVPAEARAALLFEQEHRDGDETVVADEWAAALESLGARMDDSWIAQDPAQLREIRGFRHALPEGLGEWLSGHGQAKHATDMALPADQFDPMITRQRREIAESGMASAVFGHIGDHHVHVNLLPRTDAEAAVAKDLLLRWLREGTALGGAFSAEHGVGKLKADLFAATADPVYLDEMRATKVALDPASILGRGNILRCRAAP